MTQIGREALRDQLEQSRSSLLAAVEGLSEEELGEKFYGDWSARDILAHLSAWQEVAIGDFARIGRGDVPVLVSYDPEEVDEWNEHHMRARGAFSSDQVLRELTEDHPAFLRGLNDLDDAHFLEGELIRSLCEVFIAHEAADDIQEWRKANGPH